MAKDKDKKKGKDNKKLEKAQAVVHVEASANAASPADATKPPMSNKEFEKALEPLQVELVKMQQWVIATGAKVCVLFEGRDTAGKGGVIKRITERTSPRVFRHVALPAPTEREKSQLYFQRYMPYLPAAGEVILFDRSWYNRAGVERVMGFATPEQVDNFLKYAPFTERLIINSGVILIKYWLEVDMDVQDERLRARDRDAREDLEAHAHGPAELQPLVRLLAGAGCHVCCHRYARKPVVRGESQQQAPGAAESNHPFSQPGSV